MAEKYTTYKALKRWVKNLIISMIACFFAVGVYLIIASLNLTAPIVNVLLAYDIEQKPTYKVNIIENQYIDEESMKYNKNYITNLVKNIDFNFDYIYDATKKGNYKYSYDIKATLYGEYQGGSENNNSKLWTKEYVLMDKVTKEISDVNSISIAETVVLDFPYYNNEVINFKKDLNVPIVAYMEVVMNIDIEGSADGNKIKDNKKQKFIIPLNQVAFLITDKTNANDHQEITHTEDNRAINIIKFNVGIVMIVCAISVFALTFKLIFVKKQKFDVELSRILKSYGDIIVEITSAVNIENKEIVLVKTFSDMLDLEEELRIPINFVQTQRYEGKFFIVNNDICYMWILDNQ